MSSPILEPLIKKINELQDVFANVGFSCPIDLPQIVVVGSQSSGKSSVLENIVGRDFLPRGSGIVTRRPLNLQLINRVTPELLDDEEAQKNSEWGEFLHKPNQKFFNFDDIRKEIVTETEIKTGFSGISAEPIVLKIYSPKLLNLTLVDLPGLTKVPVGDQPKDIELQLRDMIMTYIVKNNSIVLAVTAANTDLANSDALKLAREVDPEGLRTIGVLTKVDLMDAGTDVIDILAGRVIPLRLGYVPVINRSQRDIEKKVPIKDALRKEREFFESHNSYRAKAKFCGTPYLSFVLNRILSHHIQNTLPDIKAKISTELLKCKQELLQLGEAANTTTVEKSNTILNLITEFCSDFGNALDGKSSDLSSSELNGGARIGFVFHEIFNSVVHSVDPLEHVKDQEIRTILYNSSGSSPSLFVGTAAFEVIVKQQVKKLREPSLKCVKLIYEELVRILHQLEKRAVFRRYPPLLTKFHQVVIDFFRKAMQPAEKTVVDIIAAEACYVNTGHPDFISGHKAMQIVNERQGEKQVQKIQNADKRTPIGQSFPNSSAEQIGFFSTFFKKSKPPVMESPPPKLIASGNLSEREQMEIEVIKLLISSYYDIVKRTVADLIPKTIMLNLVEFAKTELQRELLTELYKTELFDKLLEESDLVVSRRKECHAKMDYLVKAEEIVNAA